MSKMINLENFTDTFNLLAERINPLFASFVIYSNCLDFGNERKEVHQEPMIRNIQLPYQATVTTFLQTDLFLVYLLFCERKAVLVQ